MSSSCRKSYSGSDICLPFLFFLAFGLIVVFIIQIEVYSECRLGIYAPFATLTTFLLWLVTKEFSTGLTFVALVRVKTSEGIMIVDRLDFSRFQKLGGKYLQYRFDDYACRYPRNI